MKTLYNLLTYILPALLYTINGVLLFLHFQNHMYGLCLINLVGLFFTCKSTLKQIWEEEK